MLERTMPKLTRIAPEFPVANLRDAIEYYERKLGFRTVMRMPAGDYAVLERDDVAIHLFQREDRKLLPVGIHVFATDLDALWSELKANGAKIVQDIETKPWGNRDFRIRDDSGNEIKFTEPRPDV
jgi:uncharacterized glyoxalase superfamily protein PhnB